MIMATVNQDVLNQYFKRLNKAKQADLYRQAARAAANPVRNELRRAWRATKRRSGAVTKKIAAAQEIRVYKAKRGANAGTTTISVGTNYKRGGSVKLWHILERGFQHYGGGKGNVYTPRDARAIDTAKREDAVAMAAHDAQLVHEVASGTEKSKYGRQRLAQARHKARSEFRAQNPEDTKHRQAAYVSHQVALKSARGSVVANRKRVLGLHISGPIAQSWIARVAPLAAKYAREMAWYQIDGKRTGAAKPRILP